MDNRVDIRHLRYFIAVAEELNFRRAAERLHLSQPPLSRQIQALEDDLGGPLFARDRSRVSLTPSGRAFLPEARKILALLDKAVVAARSRVAAEAADLAIGYTLALDRSAFPEITQILAEHFPDCPLTMCSKRSLVLIDEVRRGILDAAFIGLPAETRGLTVSELARDPFVVALPAGSPGARKRIVTLAELNEQPVFWFRRAANPSFYDYCERYFERVGFAPRRLAEPEDHHVLLGMIAEGRGIGLIPASLQRIKRDGVVFRKLREGDQIAIRIGLIYLPANRSPVLKKLVETLAQPPG